MARPRRRLLQIVVEFYGGPQDGERRLLPRFRAKDFPLTLPSTSGSLNEFYLMDGFRSTEDKWLYVHWVRKAVPKT